MRKYQVSESPELTWMQVSTGARSKSETIECALAFYKRAIQEAAAGNKIYVGAFRETSTELVVKQLENVRRWPK